MWRDHSGFAVSCFYNGFGAIGYFSDDLPEYARN
jgi:hypothetical protein